MLRIMLQTEARIRISVRLVTNRAINYRVRVENALRDTVLCHRPRPRLFNEQQFRQGAHGGEFEDTLEAVDERTKAHFRVF